MLEASAEQFMFGCLVYVCYQTDLLCLYNFIILLVSCFILYSAIYTVWQTWILKISILNRKVYDCKELFFHIHVTVYQMVNQPFSEKAPDENFGCFARQTRLRPANSCCLGML